MTDREEETIFLFDDNESFYETLMFWLSRALPNLVVVQAHTIESGLSLVQRMEETGHPEIVLLDANFPPDPKNSGSGGLIIGKQLREVGYEGPIWGISSDEKQEAWTGIVDLYLGKERKNIIDKICAHLSGSSE